MLRSYYRLNNGAIPITKQRDKIKKKSKGYENQIVKDCVREVKKRGHVVTCYSQEQLDAIIELSTVELEWNDLGWCFRIWRKK